jgi:adenosylcobinamide kinase/adenosylcobinamide-phosphate guanylyltransferase
MRITLLGTGSADGWPNPFCACASCDAERADGRSRAPSSALVDDVILVDCGPTTPHLPGRSDVTLSRVAHVLVTHGHPDHLHPAFLLSRSWTSPIGTLHVWGPARAIDLCRDWIGPDSGVDLHVVTPLDEVELSTSAGAYRVRVLPAAHAHGNGDALAEEAVLFDLTAPDGQRLLYATDTGPLPASTIAAIAGPLDVMIIDETFGDRADHGTGHLDLATLPGLLAALRDGGSVSDSTIVVVTHLSHHNPPTRMLRGRLSALGVQVVDDFDVIDTRRPYGRAATHRFVLGGARCGKSHVAEGLAAYGEQVVYVATGGKRPDDPEWAERVAEHRARRPAQWTTIETTEVTTLLLEADAASTLLVDCLALWLTAQLDETDAWSRAAAGDRPQVHDEIGQRIDALAAAVALCPADVILVSNEVGMGVVPATASGRLFRDLLGILNVRVSRACDETNLVVAGHAFPLPARPGGPSHE